VNPGSTVESDMFTWLGWYPGIISSKRCLPVMQTAAIGAAVLVDGDVDGGYSERGDTKCE
jgi:hypothetical protein